MINHLGKRLDTAVMHIRRRYSDISQAWGAKFSIIASLARFHAKAGIRFRIAIAVLDVVQTRIMKLRCKLRCRRIDLAAGKVLSLVAYTAFQPVRKKQPHAAPCGLGHRILIVEV